MWAPKLMFFGGIFAVVVVGSIMIARNVGASVDSSKTYYGRTVYNYSIAKELKPSTATLIPNNKLSVVYTNSRDSGYNSVQSMAITDKYFVVIHTDTTEARKNHVNFLNKKDFSLKKSISLDLGHANGVTWDSKNNEILVVDGKKVHRINASTFEYIGTKTITDAKDKQYNSSGIAYDAQNNRFYASSSDKIRTVTSGYKIYNYLSSDHTLTNQDIGYYNGYIYRVLWAESGGKNQGFSVDSNVLLQFAADGSSYAAYYINNPACEMESVAFDNGRPYFLYNACNGRARQAGQYAIVTVNDAATMSKMYHQYTLKYDANGGSWSGAVPSASKNNYVGLSSTLVKNKPVRANYTFLGWAKKKDAAKASYSAGDKVVLRKYGASSSDLTLYAVWKEQTYKVSYNANGGTGAPATKEYGKVSNSSVKIDSGSNLKRQYYQFIGWSTNKNATVADSKYAPGVAYTGKADLILYAVWKVQNFTISFDANGGSGAPAQISSVKTASSVVLPTVVPTRANYKFLKWNTKKDGSGSSYAAGSTYSGRENVVLYAVWQKVDSSTPKKVSTITIKYDANGGTGAPSATTGEVGKVKISSDVPEYSGREFLGWSLARNGAVAYHPGGVYSGDTSTTLYAVWNKKDVKLVMYANDGTNNYYSVTLKSGSSVALSYKPTARSGHTLIGWSRSKSSGAADYACDQTVIVGDNGLTLYAVWDATEKTISFNVNGGIGEISSIVTKKNTVTLPGGDNISREGYVFKGWSEKETPGVNDKVYSAGAEYVLPDAAEVVLYAVWEADSRPIEEVTCAPDDLTCICNLDANSAECQNRDSDPESLPKTGPGEIATLIIALMSVVTGGLYWVKSQIDLTNAQKGR